MKWFDQNRGNQQQKQNAAQKYNRVGSFEALWKR